jgi:branched-chain amino acid transport system ATP-binding protein
MTIPEPLLEAKGVEAHYGPIRALRGVDVTVRAGTITAVVGSNGAGKSTLLRTLIGAHALKRGSLRYCSESIEKWTPTRRVAAGLVLVPEGRGIIGGMTVADNLRLGADASVRKGTRGRFALDDIYEKFEILGQRRTQLAGLLSGGEQQMLAIGRALLAQPTLLMLDEPSLGLSPIITHEVMQLLAGLRDEGLAILLVEQNVRQAMKIADDYYLLETGAVVASGKAAEAKQDGQIQSAYLGGT